MLAGKNVKEEHITVDGGRLFTRHHVAASNPTEKPTIVFLHEALGSVAQWRDFPETLAAILDVNLLCYDRLGHGQSDPISKKKTSLFCIAKPGPSCPLS